MAKKSKSKFGSMRGKISKNLESRKKGNRFSYLKLPNGVEEFTPEIDMKITMDMIPYVVTDKKHMDRDEENGVAVKGNLWYRKPFRVHRNVGVRNEQVVCPTTFGNKCPICEYQTKLRKSDADDEDIKALKTSYRMLYAIKIKNNKKFDPDKFYILDMSDHLFQKELDSQLAEVEPDKYEIFADHMEGYSVRVIFAEGNFGGNKFPQPTRFDFVDRKTQYTDEDIEETPNLDNILVVLSYEELKEKFFETGGEDEDDDEPRRKKTTSSNKKKGKKDEDDDEDEDIEDYDDDDIEHLADDDEDEDDDEDDEEEDEDDDEEEPEPPKRGKVKPSSSSKRKPKELSCPEGYKFGVDNDKHDECDDCELWNECKEKKIALKKKK